MGVAVGSFCMALLLIGRLAAVVKSKRAFEQLQCTFLCQTRAAAPQQGCPCRRWLLRLPAALSILVCLPMHVLLCSLALQCPAACHAVHAVSREHAGLLQALWGSRQAVALAAKGVCLSVSHCMGALAAFEWVMTAF